MFKALKSIKDCYEKLKISNCIWMNVFSIIIIFSYIIWTISFAFHPNGSQIFIFFREMQDFLADASNTTGLVRELNPYNNDAIGLWNAAYPPLAYLLFYFFSCVTEIEADASYLSYYIHPAWLLFFINVLLIIILLFFVIIMKQIKIDKSISSVLFGIAICVSNPILYTIERGNIVLLAALFSCFFIFYYDNENKFYKEMALICLGLAAGLKITPALFGILLIRRKDFKAAIRTVLYGLLSFVLPFCFFEGGLSNFWLYLHNTQLHLQMVSAESGTGLVASFYKIKQLVEGLDYWMDYRTYAIVLLISQGIAMILIFSIFFMEEKWKIVLNLSLALLLFPSVSGRYCLLYLIPSMVLFFEHLLHEKMDILCIALFISYIMIGFVFQCQLSEIFNYNIAIPIMTIVALYYSFRGVQSKYEKKNG